MWTVRFGMGHRQEEARLIGDILEFDQAAALADDVQQVAMLAGGRVGPFAGGALTGFAAFQRTNIERPGVLRTSPTSQ